MNFPGFSPEDFLYFMDSDQFALVEYIRDSLHPRLRELGVEMAEHLGAEMGVTLRAQLRSGRWWKSPWATWVSLIVPYETYRSDNRRPRLSVIISDDQCLVGFVQNVWRRRWKNLTRHSKDLANLMAEAVSGRPSLQLALVHWVQGQQQEWERRTSVFPTPAQLLRSAAEWGQDFVLVGKIYPFPQEADLLTSPRFAETALEVLRKAYPLYYYAFDVTLGT